MRRIFLIEQVQYGYPSPSISYKIIAVCQTMEIARELKKKYGKDVIIAIENE